MATAERPPDRRSRWRIAKSLLRSPHSSCPSDHYTRNAVFIIYETQIIFPAGVGISQEDSTLFARMMNLSIYIGEVSTKRNLYIGHMRMELISPRKWNKPPHFRLPACILAIEYTTE
jgi:hypothetical protein